MDKIVADLQAYAQPLNPEQTQISGRSYCLDALINESAS
jgi:hypothetical protein